MKRTIDIPMLFSVGKAQTGNIRLKFDLTTMLNNVDMRHELATHSFDNPALAIRMADAFDCAGETGPDRIS